METLFALLFATTLKLGGSSDLVFAPTTNWDRIKPSVVETSQDTTRQHMRDVVPREGRDESDSDREVISLIYKYFPEEPELAVLVARAESGLSRQVVNYLGCVGIFQIRALKGRPSIEELQNPEVNIKYARSLYDWAGGTFRRDWEVCTKGMVNCK